VNGTAWQCQADAYDSTPSQAIKLDITFTPPVEGAIAGRPDVTGQATAATGGANSVSVAGAPDVAGQVAISAAAAESLAGASSPEVQGQAAASIGGAISLSSPALPDVAGQVAYATPFRLLMPAPVGAITLLPPSEVVKVTGEKILTMPAPITLGTFPRHIVTGGDAVFLGVVDDVQIHAAAASVEEECRLAMRELDGTESDLVEYWKFSTGTGSTAFGELGADGTLLGTTQWVGFEGGDAARGKHKPRVWGTREAEEGVLADEQRLVWQVNVGPTKLIVPTEGGHESLTFAGDHPNEYDVAQPAAGTYITSLARGMCRLGAEPVRLAFRVQGSDPTTDGESGYSANPGIIMRRIAQREAGVVDAEMDFAAMDLIAATHQGVVGLGIGAGPVRIADALDRIAATVDGWWAYLPSGLFSGGLRAASAAAVSVDFDLTEDDLDVSGPSRSKTAEVASRWRLRYQQRAVTMSSIDDVLVGVPTGERYDKTQEWRAVTTEPPIVPIGDSLTPPPLPLPDEDPVPPPPIVGVAVATAFRDAKPYEADVLWESSTDASRSAWGRLSIDRFPRDLYAFPTRNLSHRWPWKIGSTFRYTGRFASAGRLFVLVGVDEDPVTGRVVLTGWSASPPYADIALIQAQLASAIDPAVIVAGAAGRGEYP
jgi:hypothetical protein